MPALLARLYVGELGVVASEVAIPIGLRLRVRLPGARIPAAASSGLTIDPGPRPTGYREGSMGWFVDEPYYGFPDGGGMRTRLTAVLREEDGRWKVVHLHVSVGVPDEEVQELQARWGVL